MLGKNPAKVMDTEKHIGNYLIDKTIGQGTYGKVKLGFHMTTKEKVAIKVIEKSSIENDRQAKRIQKEIRFLKLLYHPSIVRILDVQETDTQIFMVMEYAPGGELFDYIVAHKRVKEKEARVFFRQIISALDYCHQNSVIHRDLKPENLLLDEHKNIKIIDFGFSNFFETNTLLNTFCGSPFYAAPEMILGKRYEGPEVDIWSLGVILFALLCGHLPFDDDDVKELYKKISSAQYNTPSYLSPESKDLISRMITVHPKKRATLEEVKNHSWVNEGYSGPPENLIPPRKQLEMNNLDQDILDKLLTFGYVLDEVKTPLSPEAPTNPIRSTYYLLTEMYKREEEKIKKLRAEPRIDVTGRSTVDTLGSISEDGIDDNWIPSSPPLGRYARLIDDFSRSSSSSPSSPLHHPSSPFSPNHPTPMVDSAAIIKGRRASTSMVQDKNGPLFPSKKKVAPEPPSTNSNSRPTSPEQAPEEPPKPRGRRLSLPAIEYSKKKPTGTGKDDIPGAGKIRTLSGWFSVSTTSSKPEAEIVKEIQRVLNANEITFEYDGGFCFSCEDASRKNPIGFEIEICKVTRMALYGLHLKRIRGSIWNYKKLCNKLLPQMVL